MSLLRSFPPVAYPSYSVSQNMQGLENGTQRDHLIKNLVSIVAGSAILELDHQVWALIKVFPYPGKELNDILDAS